MPVSKINLLAVAPSSVLPELIKRDAPEEIFNIKICKSPEEIPQLLRSGNIHAALLGSDIAPGKASGIIGGMRANRTTMFIPVFLIDDSHVFTSEELVATGADGAFGYSHGESDHSQVSLLLSTVRRRVEEVTHPVTRLLHGAALENLLADTAHDVKRTTFFLMVKVLGLKAFNIYKNYDEGDRLLATVSAALCEIVNAQGSEGDVVAHLSGDEFIIITHEKRIENLCKNIMVRTERLIRGFYTPFELMKGYISIESENRVSHFYLAEVIVAGAEVPTHWDSHYIYITDMLKDLCKKVDSEELGFRIIKLG